MGPHHGTKYQQALQRYHSRRVRAKSFDVGDLTLGRVKSSKGWHKISEPWEGPYMVAEIIRPGAY